MSEAPAQEQVLAVKKFVDLLPDFNLAKVLRPAVTAQGGESSDPLFVGAGFMPARACSCPCAGSGGERPGHDEQTCVVAPLNGGPTLKELGQEARTALEHWALGTALPPGQPELRGRSSDDASFAGLGWPDAVGTMAHLAEVVRAILRSVTGAEPPEGMIDWRDEPACYELPSRLGGAPDRPVLGDLSLRLGPGSALGRLEVPNGRMVLHVKLEELEHLAAAFEALERWLPRLVPAWHEHRVQIACADSKASFLGQDGPPLGRGLTLLPSPTDAQTSGATQAEPPTAAGSPITQVTTP